MKSHTHTHTQTHTHTTQNRSIGGFLTFILIIEDFLHQNEQHSDGFVFIELLCDFVLCTHVAITALYYGNAYFRDSWTRLAEPVVAFLCITSLYVYEATARAAEGRVSHETVLALDMFRDMIRVIRLFVFANIIKRTMRKYHAMVESGDDVDVAEIGGDEIDISHFGVQMADIVTLPSIQVTTRRVEYDEIPGATVAGTTFVNGRSVNMNSSRVVDDRLVHGSEDEEISSEDERDEEAYEDDDGI